MARLPKGARELLIEIAVRGPLKVVIEKPALIELKKRGIVTFTGMEIETTPNISRRISTYELTEHGRHVVSTLRSASLDRARVARFDVTVEHAVGFVSGAKKRGR